MQDDDPVLAVLAAHNPHPGSAQNPGGEPELSRMREKIMATPAPRNRRRALAGPLAAICSLLLVIAVAVVFLHAGNIARRDAPAARAPGDVRILLRLRATSAHPRISAMEADEELGLLRARVSALGLADVTVRRVSALEIAVRVPRSAHPAAVARSLTTAPELSFTDWEANVIAPDGRTAASQLLKGNSAAQMLSQGVSGEPGAANAGAMPLLDAVRLAARQPTRPSGIERSRLGSEWFAFGRGGSAACHRRTPSCYAAGPSATRSALHAAPGDQVLAVPQGTIVVRAISSTGADVDYRDTLARYFVLRDQRALSGTQLSSADASVDDGRSVMSVHFTSRGVKALRALTASVARRGARLGDNSTNGYQHFAIILNGSLLTVPYINNLVYPDGLTSASQTVQISGGLTATDSRQIATELQLANRVSIQVVSTR